MTGPKPKVYLDANVFIAAFERAGAHADHAWWILHAIEEGDLSAVTSELTLSELLVKPLEVGDVGLATGYQEMLVSGDVFEVLPVDRTILIQAAELRAKRKSLLLPDAVHAATALSRFCAAFITDEKRMPLPEALRIFQVSPFTVDDVLDLLK